MYVESEGKLKKTFPRYVKGERIHHQPTCITRKVKRRTVISNGNLDLYKEMMSTGNGNDVGNCGLLLLLFKYL